MDLNASTVWWLVAGGLVALELASGTFYLLMLAVGAAASAISAHLGLGLVGQLFSGALVGGGAVAAWHLSPARRATGGSGGFTANRDINLDIGSTVQVTQWHADGTARVSYRGAAWDARYGGTGTAPPGEYIIQALDGNRLVLGRSAP